MICIIACSIIACSNREENYTSPGSGFNEEVFFAVEWIDDDTKDLREYWWGERKHVGMAREGLPAVYISLNEDKDRKFY